MTQSNTLGPAYAKLMVATWDGTKAVGPALYTSGEIAFPGYTAQQRWNWEGDTNFSVPLTGGQNYIAFMSLAGEANPVLSSYAANNSGSGVFDDGGLPGGFTYVDLGTGTDPLPNIDWWPMTYGFPPLVYRATFNVAATPLPAALPLFVSALGGLGLFGWRRRKASA